MRFITSHFSCLTCISLFWSDADVGSQGVVVFVSDLIISVLFCLSSMVKTDIVQYLFFCDYLHREALCGCVDILLAVAIQCSEKFFMRV